MQAYNEGAPKRGPLKLPMIKVIITSSGHASGYSSGMHRACIGYASGMHRGTDQAITLSGEVGEGGFKVVSVPGEE